MPNIQVEKFVNAPLADVWKTWDNYGEVAAFHPGVEKSYLLEDSAPSGKGAKRRCDFVDGKNHVLDACYCPTDGHLQPAELVQAYIKVGKNRGVEYQSNCPVEQIMVQGGKVCGVKTAGGEYHAPIVVNATGPWSYLVAGMVETALPTAAMGHHYLTTRPDPGVPVDRMSPAVRNRHHRLYTRPESGGLIIGMYEAEPLEYDTEELPIDFDMSALKAPRDDYNVAMLIHSAQQRFPWINERTQISHL